MPCPTCDHTLEGIGYKMFHCPRCGTLVNCPIDGAVHVPALVRRCREFATSLRFGDPFAFEFRDKWVTLGVADSINLPNERET